MGRAVLNISLFAALFVLVFSSAAFAQELSRIQVEVQSSELVAVNVFDDDDSIGFVDVFVATGTSVNQYQFSRVGEGPLFTLPLFTSRPPHTI